MTTKKIKAEESNEVKALEVFEQFSDKLNENGKKTATRSSEKLNNIILEKVQNSEFDILNRCQRALEEDISGSIPFEVHQSDALSTHTIELNGVEYESTLLLVPIYYHIPWEEIENPIYQEIGIKRLLPPAALIKMQKLIDESFEDGDFYLSSILLDIDDIIPLNKKSAISDMARKLALMFGSKYILKSDNLGPIEDLTKALLDSFDIESTTSFELGHTPTQYALGCFMRKVGDKVEAKISTSQNTPYMLLSNLTKAEEIEGKVDLSNKLTNILQETLNTNKNIKVMAHVSSPQAYCMLDLMESVLYMSKMTSIAKDYHSGIQSADLSIHIHKNQLLSVRTVFFDKNNPDQKLETDFFYEPFRMFTPATEISLMQETLKRMSRLEVNFTLTKEEITD